MTIYEHGDSDECHMLLQFEKGFKSYKHCNNYRNILFFQI